jgi:predicted CoA-binding protein
MNHDAYDPAYIRDILVETRTIAVVGASANPARPSFLVFKYLVDKGFVCTAVNPGVAGSTLSGRPVVARLADIAEPIDMVDVFRSADAVPAIVEECLALTPPPKTLWLQLGVRHDEAARAAETGGMRVVQNRCTKIEYGKHSGEWTWVGGASGLISSRRLARHGSGRYQSLGIAPATRRT